MVEFIKYFVDKSIAEKIIECELLDKDFITKKYKAFSADLLYQVKLADAEQDLYLFILFESKSKQTYLEPLEVLNYEILAYKKLLRMKKIKKPLPPMLPIVVYNGPEKYTSPLNINELIDDRIKSIRKYIP